MVFTRFNTRVNAYCYNDHMSVVLCFGWCLHMFVCFVPSLTNQLRSCSTWAAASTAVTAALKRTGVGEDGGPQVRQESPGDGLQLRV